MSVELIESNNHDLRIAFERQGAFSRTSFLDPGFILVAITSDEDVFLGHPTLVSSAFRTNADG
jgi:hypothetical protein